MKYRELVFKVFEEPQGLSIVYMMEESTGLLDIDFEKTHKYVEASALDEKDKVIERLLQEIKRSTDRAFYEHCSAKVKKLTK